MNRKIHFPTFQRWKAWPCFFLVAYLTFQSCVPVGRLAKDEYLLYDQEIKGTKRIKTYELEAFYRQEPNRKIRLGSSKLTFMPWLYAYYLGKKRFDKKKPDWEIKLHNIDSSYSAKIQVKQAEYDTLIARQNPLIESKKFMRDSANIIQEIRKLRQKQNEKIDKWETRIEEGNLLMRSIGEKPAIYDRDLARSAAIQMEKYLALKGHFKSTVLLKEDTVGVKRKKIKLTYEVTEKKPYATRIFEYQIPDTTLFDIVLADRKHSLIQEGQVYDEKDLEGERKRLVNVLKNKGYFEFNSSYIFYEVDSTVGNNFLDITLKINNLPDNQIHQKFYIDEVVFETDVDIRKSLEKDSLQYDGILFLQTRNRYSKRILASKIAFRTDSVYSQEAVDNTQLALTRIDMFKFVNINFEKKGSNRLKVSIFTSDYDKYTYSLEGGLNVTRSLPGPFVSLSLKNRNVLRNADILELSGRLAFEAQGDVTNVSNNYSSQEYGLGGSFTLPFVLFPLTKKIKQALSIYQPKTVLQAGYNLIDRPEYSRSSLQGSFGYNWITRKKALFSFGVADVSILRSVVTSSFDSLLENLSQQGSTLKLSFQNSYISHFNASYTKSSNNYGSISERNYFFKVYGEIGGLFSDFWSRLYRQDEGQILGLNYFKYVKFFVDYRQGIPLGVNNLIATRLHLGVASPYGTKNSLPYEKYFFTGGSNSNRAWRPRRVGPGSNEPLVNDDGSFNYQLEQPGELLLEANLEWRFKLFGFVDWAFFVDGSNVWLIKPDPTKPGGDFKVDRFWKEVAVGAGYGLRLDFSFLLIRFDIGMKMYDPARAEGDRFIGQKVLQNFPFGQSGQTEFNIGIGYPF